MFNHTTLEADIERLGREVAEKKLKLEHKELSEREIVKKAIEPVIKQQIPVQQPDDSGEATRSQILPDYLKDAADDVKLKVEKLVDVVFHKGVETAVREAMKANNPFILDALHDALTDKLYAELKERKLL